MSAYAEHFREGEGEPLLLLHGFSATWHTWGPLPRQLAERGFDVFAPTLPGHTGGPELPEVDDEIDDLVDRIEAMLDELGWETAHLVGFSLGGWLSLELAKRGRARTVTAFSPGGAKTERHAAESKRIKFLFWRLHRSARLAGRRLDRLYRRPGFRKLAMAEQMVRGDRLTPREATEMSRRFVACPVFDRFLAEIGTEPGLEDLDRVRVPVTIAWAEKDQVLPQKFHESFFRTRLADAEFRTVRGAGHVPFWDAPDEVLDAVLSRAGAGAARAVV